ncbi:MULTISPECIES: alpha/beta hydrolase [unclassified Sphingobium]|uniref:alpha/beta hydrolase n=1 Tax=unclassified Sphingobium TaxID=2611147 RepID=UPI0022257575|nr:MULTISPECIES: alpha/beta hydrolase-fold protein [unclassified Sphingobium]MCW2395741.1 S-formylglutathione hydrolase FrmB [Sphingobium sp. B8D3B]MCW2419256.1 S-formylglutathione hydrolase FrmB [Sphingobium sp. B8D3C]
MRYSLGLATIAAALALFSGPLHAQDDNSISPSTQTAPPIKGRVDRVKVHGVSLAGNLMGETDSPEVSIYLPPSYAKNPKRHYPVIYFLHGYNGADTQYFRDPGPRYATTAVEEAFSSGAAQEMIIVIPNCMNGYGGCMYSNSPVTGNWEDFIADDLVAYVDQHYRTLAKRESRGIAGQSMGGYGTLRIAMKRPDVFSSMWAMAPCCLNQGYPASNPVGQQTAIEAIKTMDDLRAHQAKVKASGRSDHVVLVAFATAAAWSPNPDKPPFYFDLPVKDGAIVPEVAARYGANSPLALVSQFAPNLMKYKALALDVGRDDSLLPSIREFDARLNQLKIPHAFTVRDGDHGSHVVSQIGTKILPFFSRNLSFQASGGAEK